MNGALRKWQRNFLLNSGIIMDLMSFQIIVVIFKVESFYTL